MRRSWLIYEGTQNVLITAGCNMAAQIVLQTVAKAGDEVMYVHCHPKRVALVHRAPCGVTYTLLRNVS
jgi:DNA-binding transcriptional MocR family regulator